MWDVAMDIDALDGIGVFGKPSRRRGVRAWFHDVWTLTWKSLRKFPARSVVECFGAE
jgi:hypothetical protein